VCFATGDHCYRAAHVLSNALPLGAPRRGHAIIPST
jgi:hypothetical protein